MSNEMRDLLRGAAASPSSPPDVKDAWKRGRSMRVQRRALGALAIVAVVVVSLGIAQIAPNLGGAPPATYPTAPVGCGAGPILTTIPSWARSANPPTDLLRSLSPDGNVLAILFSAPFSPPNPERPNTFQFIVRTPSGAQPLAITATRGGHAVVHATATAGRSSKQTYVTVVNVPSAGCWHFQFAWNGHRSSMDIHYQPFVPPSTTTVVLPTTTTVPETSPPPDCATANLALTLGPERGSAGHFNFELRLRNIGTVRCAMFGFLGVSFLDAAGDQIGVPATRNVGGAILGVRIAPGATAYALLAEVDTSVQNCPPATAHAIRVYPPNETASLTVAVSGLQVCSDQTPGALIYALVDYSVS
jgi:hypothetical protein